MSLSGLWPPRFMKRGHCFKKNHYDADWRVKAQFRRTGTDSPYAKKERCLAKQQKKAITQ